MLLALKELVKEGLVVQTILLDRVLERQSDFWFERDEYLEDWADATEFFKFYGPDSDSEDDD